MTPQRLLPVRAVLTVGARNLSALNHGWVLCRHDAETPADLPPNEADWAPICTARTVAAALRQTVAWSLDADRQDFDAQVWWFRLQFDDLVGETSATASTALRFDGLATLCEVWLNGRALLSSDNMFVQHDVALDSPLRPTGNELLLRFGALGSKLAEKRPRPAWRTPMVAHQQLRGVRTTLLGRTPGWSPPVAAVGPWRPIWLEKRSPVTVSSVRLQARLDGGDGVLNITLNVDLDVEPGGTEQGIPQGLQALRASTIEVHVLDVLGPQGANAFRVDLQQATSHGAGVQFSLRVPGVSPWWPHTHGPAPLYAVSVTVTRPDGASQSVALGKVGFRAVALDQSDDRFSLSINAVPVFCRGACWMPLDVVSLQANEAAYRLAITQVRDAGMNMLRIAGATVYEDDLFFDICDELGVMVWQDLMFSNMDYPEGDAAFAQSVKLEVTQQLGRLQHHPSVVVVCGNSEVEQQAAMWGAPREAWAPALFHDTLATVVRDALGAQALYWPSSAHGGAFPHQVDSGTCSYYGVGAYKRDLDDARTSQLAFATECLAFANIPPVSTLRRAPAGEVPQVHAPAWKSRVYRDLSVGWDFDDVRDHYIERLLQLRPDELRAIDPARHLTLGRAVGAEVMARSMAAWRTAAPRCGGALVWYLRDLWAGAGVGLVDDQGAPKSVLHALRRVQQSHLASIEDRGLNGLVLHLLNETPDAIEGRVEVLVYQHGETQVARHTLAVSVPARGHVRRPVLDWLTGFMDLTQAYRFGPAASDLVVVNWRDEAELVISQALHHAPQQMIAFNGDPGLSAQATLLDDGRVSVQVRSRAAAYGVHFVSFGWQPDDEFFHLSPGNEKEIVFSPLPVITGVKLGRVPTWYATVHALNARKPSPVPKVDG